LKTIFGYESGEMTGKHASIVNAPTDLTPEARAEEIMTVVRKTGEWYGDVNNIKKDGTTFWCYVSVSVFNHPKFGEVLLAVHTDITERKQIEEVLKDNEDRYRQIYQFSPDSVIIHDMDMNILDANNKAVEEFGYSKEELLKKKIFDLHPETELKHSAQVLDAMKKKEDDDGRDRVCEEKRFCIFIRINSMQIYAWKQTDNSCCYSKHNGEEKN